MLAGLCQGLPSQGTGAARRASQLMAVQQLHDPKHKPAIFPPIFLYLVHDFSLQYNDWLVEDKSGMQVMLKLP